jgi:capsular exopolysaccharide synthesis family protein
VAAIRAKKESYWSQLASQIKSLRVALSARVSIEEEKLKNLEGQLGKSRTEQQDAKTRAASYNEAKNNYIQAKKVLEEAEIRLWTEMMQRSMPMNPAVIWEKAEVAEVAARPRVWLNMALGIFFGVVLGVGVAFFIEYLDTSVKTMEDIEKYFGLPVLAVIPKGTGVLMDLPHDTPDAEPYRILRTNIEFNRRQANANVMTLVSGGPGEGKSTTLVNLAFTFAQSGMRTLVVDADLRRPRQHAIFGVSNGRGLTDCLSKGIPIEELIQNTKVENLYLIPSGKLPPGAIAMLNSRRFTDLLDNLKTQYDMVLVDAPPILGVSDSSVIARAVDITAIVIQHRRFPRAMLMRVKNAVVNAGGNLLGAILNNVDIRLDQYYEYQTNYYGYYHKPTQEETKAAAAASVKAKPPVATAGVGHTGGGRDEY